jgi:hypothetical protein
MSRHTQRHQTLSYRASYTRASLIQKSGSDSAGVEVVSWA